MTTKPRNRPAAVDELLAEAGARVRDVFVAHYKSAYTVLTGSPCTWGDRHMACWDGGTDKSGKLHQPAWPKIAAFCVEHGLDPTLLVKAQFKAATRKSGYADRGVEMLPKPNQCYGRSALANYERHAAGSPEQFKAVFESQANQLKIEVNCAKARARQAGTTFDPKSAVRAVLRNPRLPLSGLFRHCVASASGLDDVAEEFLAPAFRQYVFSRAVYDEAWGDAVTPAVREMTDEFHKAARR